MTIASVFVFFCFVYSQIVCHCTACLRDSVNQLVVIELLKIIVLYVRVCVCVCACVSVCMRVRQTYFEAVK